MSVHGIDWESYPELFTQEGNDVQNIAHTYATVSTRSSWKVGRNLSGNHAPECRHHDSFHPDPRDIAKAVAVLRPILADETEGATIGIDYLPYDTAGRYVVGGRYPGVAYDDTEDIRDIAGQLHRYMVQTPWFGDSDKIIGIWRNNGLIYIDYVSIHSGYLDALAIARERTQVAFFDSAINRSIDAESERYV